MIRALRTITIAAFAASALASAPASAEDIFVVSAGNPFRPGTYFDVNQVPSFATVLHDLGDPASIYAGNAGAAPFTVIDIDFAGVGRAIVLRNEAFGGRLGGRLLTITRIAGSSETIQFDAADGDIGQQLENFFYDNDDAVIAAFQQEIAKRSAIAMTDGNPLASTARAADLRWRYFGLRSEHAPPARAPHTLATQANLDLHPLIDPAGDAPRAGSQSDAPESDPASPSRRLSARFDLAYESARVDGSLNRLRGAIPYSYRAHARTISSTLEYTIADAASLALSGYLNRTTVEGSAAYHAGLSIDAPLRLARSDADEDDACWITLTPGLGISVSGSDDLAAGGWLWTTGFTLAGGRDLGPVSITGAAQFTVHRSQKGDVGPYRFDQRISQEIIKVGAAAAVPLSDRLSIEAGLTWTDFLRDTAVDSYLSPHAGLDIDLGQGRGLRLTATADLADNFDRYSGEFAFVLPF